MFGLGELIRRINAEEIGFQVQVLIILDFMSVKYGTSFCFTGKPGMFNMF